MGSNIRTNILVTAGCGALTIIGAILLGLSIGSGGRAPLRHQSSLTAPLGTILLIVGLGGGISYAAWRRRSHSVVSGDGMGAAKARKRVVAHPGHSVTFTPAASDRVRRMFEKNPKMLKALIIRVVTKPDGRVVINESVDQSLLTSPQFATAMCNDTVVVVPREDVERFADLVVDYRDGWFKFLGSAVPPQASASDPGGLALSREMLLDLNPDLALEEDVDHVDRIAANLRIGDRRAAVVVSVKPLVVAAYTDELDAVALLKFPDHLVEAHALKRGSRLITINVYDRGPAIASDLVCGENHFDRFANFFPHIGNFLSNDSKRLAELIKGIERDEWQRTVELVADAWKRAKGRFRDGRPPNSGEPAY